MKVDLILHGGRVHTMADRHFTGPVSAVAVAGGRIVTTGGEELLDLGGAHTLVRDLHGATVLPGFVDAHAHPVAGGLALLQCDLSGVHSLEDYRRVILRFVAEHPRGWVEGAGWYGDLFPGGYPTRGVLDELVPDRPVALVSHDAHSYWVNSQALRAAGIGCNTQDPPGGRILRDDEGVPRGLLMENAMALIEAVKPQVTPALIGDAMLAAQRYFHSLGITSWVDAAVGQALGFPDTFEEYLSHRDEISSRVSLALLVPPGADDAQMDALAARRDRLDEVGGRLRAVQAKLILDGNCENLTGAVHDDYEGHPGERGILQFEAEDLARICRGFEQRGFDLHLHAVGDRAVTSALDALAAPAMGRGRWGRHHQIAHIDLIRDEDVERMHRLGVVANVTPLWARQDPVLVETKLPLLTTAQRARHFLYGTLERAGVALAFGSDWPVSTPDPIAQLHTAVNRTAAPGDPHACDRRSLCDPLLGGEAITVAGALWASTRGSALAAGLEDHVGRLESGRDADMVVLDRDPMQVPHEELGTVTVRATFVSGELVHES